MFACRGFSRPAWKPPSVCVLSRKVTIAQGCACVANAANDMRDVPRKNFYEGAQCGRVSGPCFKEPAGSNYLTICWLSQWFAGGMDMPMRARVRRSATGRCDALTVL